MCTLPVGTTLLFFIFAALPNGSQLVQERLYRVAMVREKYLENEIYSRSGKSQGILWMAKEIQKGLAKSGKSQGI